MGQGKQRELLVCDLQGVFTRERFAFDWVDPVIHSDLGGHKSLFSRTDRGADGMKEFMRTHKCNALCRQARPQHTQQHRDPRAVTLRLACARAQLKMHNFDYDPAYKSPSKGEEDESRNTSQFTVEATNHLQHRKQVCLRHCLGIPLAHPPADPSRDWASLPSVGAA